MRRHVPGCPWCRGEVYIPTAGFEIEGGADFSMTDWDNLPYEGAVVRYTWRRPPSHPHAVMFNYWDNP